MEAARSAWVCCGICMGGGRPRLLLLRADGHRRRARDRWFLVDRHTVAALWLRLRARLLLVSRCVWRLLRDRVITRATRSASCSKANRLSRHRTDFGAFATYRGTYFGNTHRSYSIWSNHFTP